MKNREFQRLNQTDTNHNEDGIPIPEESKNLDVSYLKVIYSEYDQSKMLSNATSASWLVNWLLLFAKTIVVLLSSSKAILAALVDSIVDLVAQAVLSLSEIYSNRYSADYPVGRSRLEALSVLACAFIMIIASIEVVQFSFLDIYDGLNGQIPQLDLTILCYAMLLGATLLKGILYLYCSYISRFVQSDTLEALIEDHLNDVMSNSVAIVTASTAYNFPNVWWIDPLGAIIISIVIIGRWCHILNDQLKNIVGHTAPPEFINQV